MRLSEAGLRFLKHAEGFREELYEDAGGWAIGYGCQVDPDVWRGKTITQDEAERLLRIRVAQCEQAITEAVSVALQQHEFDALAIFCFNAGVKAFRGSTLVRRLNLGKTQGAAGEFSRWVFSQGKIAKGLVERRDLERRVFLGESVEHYNVETAA